jgi:microcin C transport system permease protein
MSGFAFHLNPVTAKRWRRFRRLRRAWASLWLLLILYGIGLLANVLCNDTPLYVRCHDRVFLPLLRYVPEDALLHNGKQTRPDYKTLAASPLFRSNAANRIVFAPVPYGPNETIDPATIPVDDTVTLGVSPLPRLASLNVSPDLRIVRATGAAFFMEAVPPGEGAPPRPLDEVWPLSAATREALARRFRNEPAPTFAEILQRDAGQPRRAELLLPEFTPRSAPPPTVRLTLREAGDTTATATRLIVFDRTLHPRHRVPDWWRGLDAATQTQLLALVSARFLGPVEPHPVEIAGRPCTVTATRPEVQWPYPPVAGHWLGTDSAGRDVLVRLIYGLRTSMTFGFLLVVLSMGVGILIGAVQGYWGGRVDLAGQRLTEIWSAIPFLYVMILLGSVYGRGFALLLVVYALFNWIGISYYMRAEFLRLRHLPFVDSARASGLPDRLIMFRHILPNALVPVITFFPFNLVGAIGSLAALDYLGFGLPPPTPSWGELLQQAQQFRWAWWLILYPSLALFAVMLFGVFVGEGMRHAYDPRPQSRLE